MASNRSRLLKNSETRQVPKLKLDTGKFKFLKVVSVVLNSTTNILARISLTVTDLSSPRQSFHVFLCFNLFSNKRLPQISALLSSYYTFFCVPGSHETVWSAGADERECRLQAASWQGKGSHRHFRTSTQVRWELTDLMMTITITIVLLIMIITTTIHV